MNIRWIVVLWFPAMASSQMQCGGVLHSLEDFTVVFKTVSDRVGSGQQSCGDTVASGDVIRRVLYDTSGKPYFGYQIRITPAGDNQYRAEMGPLADPPLLSFSRFPKPVIVRADEYIDVPVLERRGARVGSSSYLDLLLAWLGLASPNLPRPPGRVTDYFQIVSKGMPWAGIPIRGWAETPPPGSLLTLDRPHLSNLVSDLGRNYEMGVIGPVVWLYRDGLGRFLFSASARPGFRKTAVVEGAVLRFSDERGGPTVDEYTVGLRSNALPMPGTWMIWMKHEPAFRRPVGPWTKGDLKNGILALGVEK